MALLPPTFVYAGPPKCGSTWLAQILREHPDVFVPPAKDIMYFDSHYDRPLDWYYGFFQDRGHCRQAGEICHNYFEHPKAAERMWGHMPQIKLLFILRNPIERALSHWMFERALGGRSIGFREFCSRSDISAINDYASNMERYVRHFPRNQMLVQDFREIGADPVSLCRRIFRFLEIDAGFEPPSLHRRILQGGKARSRLLSAMAYRSAKLVRAMGGANMVGRIKQHSLLFRLLFQERTEKPLVMRGDLEYFFEWQLGMLPRLVGVLERELPASWYAFPADGFAQVNIGRATASDAAQHP